MLGKEEIENIKRGLTEELGRSITANECGVSTNDFSESIKTLEGALNYINQLESEKQNLIEKLEKRIKEAKESIVHWKKSYEYSKTRNDEIYIQNCKAQVDMWKSRLDTLQEILSIVKEEKDG